MKQIGLRRALPSRKQIARRVRRATEGVALWGLTLSAMAKRHRNPQITYVGVTGSCAKTTTTMLVDAVLSAAGECRAGVEQNNAEAVARTVLSLGPATKFCVHEICGARPGKIARQTRILRPQIGVITTIGGDHYTAYRTLEATAQEKGRLAECLPEHGVAVLNADDANVLAIGKRTRAKVVTYGLSPDADVRGSEISGNWPDRLSLTVTYGGETVRVTSNLVGEFWTTSILAAIACGLACGVDLKTCADAIARAEPVLGRCSVHPAPGGAVYVFDHKAPMWTLDSAFDFMANARAPRRTMVIGSISDSQGKASKKYRRIARQALEVADRVLFVGPLSGHVSKLQAEDVEKRLFIFQTTYEAAEFMRRQQQVPGEMILLKGTITLDHLERIVLSQTETVVCWRQACGKRYGCPQCSNYRKPSPPPFGLQKSPGTVDSGEMAAVLGN